jgi:hypothetical protein
MSLDFDAHYKVNGWPGVAVYPVEHIEYPREEWSFIGNDDDDRDDEDNYILDVWYEKDESQVYVIMVGDDTRHLVDVDDLVKIEETDFCRECGQIGCGHLVYE